MSDEMDGWFDRIPPPPNTAHPSLADQAEFVRRLMADGRHTVVLPRPSGISMLTVHRAWAPAPYVGDPFVYVWPVAMDEARRWVSGEVSGG